MSECLFSIIIPVYNAEKTLSRCVNSVISQTATDWELILVDDGSPDRSGKICDDYVATDKRIKVIHKQNGGVSSARNTGLEMAIGKYILFLDADDWLENRHLTDMANFPETDLRIISFSIERKDTTTLRISPDAYFDSPEGICKGLNDHFYDFFLAPWGKRYKRDIICKKNIKFNSELHFGEDRIFVLEYLCNCRSISFSSNISLHYDCTIENSLSKKTCSDWQESLALYDKGMECVERIGQNLSEKIYPVFGSMILYHLERLGETIATSRLSFEKKQQIYRHIFVDKSSRLLTDNLIGIKVSPARRLIHILAKAKAFSLLTLFIILKQGY